MTLQNTDNFLVNRSGINYFQNTENLTIKLQDTDLMLVNRGGTNYKITGLELKDSLVKPYPIGTAVEIGSYFYYNPVRNVLVAWGGATLTQSSGINIVVPTLELNYSLDGGSTWQSLGSWPGGFYANTIPPSQSGIQQQPFGGPLIVYPDGLRSSLPSNISSQGGPSYQYPFNSLALSTYTGGFNYFFSSGLTGPTWSGIVQNPNTGTVITCGWPSYEAEGQAYQLRSTDFMVTSSAGISVPNRPTLDRQNPSVVKYLNQSDIWVLYAPGGLLTWVSINDGANFTQPSGIPQNTAFSGFASLSQSNVLFLAGGTQSFIPYISSNRGSFFTAGAPVSLQQNESIGQVFVANGRYYFFSQLSNGVKLWRSTDGFNWTSTDVSSNWTGFNVIRNITANSVAVTPQYVFVGAVLSGGQISASPLCLVFPLSYFT